MLKKITNANWYIKNDDIHRDLGIDTVTEAVKRSSSKHILRLLDHKNPLFTKQQHKMPPNANANTEEQLPEELTPSLEAANQKVEETTQREVFRELAQKLKAQQAESQKMFTQATTWTPKTTTEAEEELTTTAVSTIQKIDEMLTEVIAEKTSLPAWGVVAITILVFLVVFGILFLCVRRFLKKRRTKDGKGKKGVDMKSVQLLGSAYKEKVQPDMEELTENAEEGDVEDKQSVCKYKKYSKSTVEHRKRERVN